ncbi:MAG TPA: hypothetical protein VLE97_11190 [Gaiellaceae bacterium]|nr:hypothetical protein [Gaiellaceae bacterium]
MSTKRTPAHLDREIASALSRGGRSPRRHATLSAPGDVRQQFVEAFLALQHAFEAADEVTAKAHNQAVRSGGNTATLAKLKVAANRMEKALRTYGEDVDELLSRLD